MDNIVESRGKKVIPHTTVWPNIKLHRMHPKLGEYTTWSVSTEDDEKRKINHGIVTQRKNDWITKKIGWHEYPIKFWIGYPIWSNLPVVGKTRNEVARILAKVK